MFSLILFLTFVGEEPQLIQPVKGPVILNKVPASQRGSTVGNANEGAAGWVRQDDILVGSDGTAHLRKMAKLRSEPTDELTIRVVLRESGWLMECFIPHFWEEAAVVSGEGWVEVKGIVLRYKGKE